MNVLNSPIVAELFKNSEKRNLSALNDMIGCELKIWKIISSRNLQSLLKKKITDSLIREQIDLVTERESLPSTEMNAAIRPRKK